MKKVSLKQQAYDIIKEKIITCQYPPNMVLNEEQLREEVGGSRTPVRDAISRLEQEKLVKILPKKGIIVSPISIREINMIDETRMLIEPYAVRKYGHKVSADRYREIWEDIQQTSSAAQDVNKVYEIDKVLHQEFIEASENEYLMDVYRRIYAQVRRLRILSGEHSQDRLVETREEHLAILKACLEEDWQAAGRAMELHLKQSKRAAVEAVFKGQWIDI